MTRAAAVATDFASPSGNIGCYVADGSARCDIAGRSREPPPEPADCELGWGQGIALCSGPASFICAGDTALGAQTVLPYGQSVVVGDLRCDNVRTGHGFTLTRQAYA